MSVPTNTNFGKLRSSSGTVAYYWPNQIIWRPAKPLVLSAGLTLVIPVSGLTSRHEGTFPLWLTASTATGTVLIYATGTIALVYRTTPCVATWDTSHIQAENAKPRTAG